MLLVKDLMSTDLFTLKRTDTLKSARTLMELARIRHIPIVDEENHFIGIVTHRDVLTATVSKLAGIDTDIQDELDSGIPIMEIMRADVTSIRPDMKLAKAARILLNHKYGCLPVVENEFLVGIITEADFLKLSISLMDALEGMEQEAAAGSE